MDVFQYELQPYKVDLKSAFGTNHSVTNSRTNAYLLVNGVGMAEIGLPPKKQNCYFTDYQDVEQFFSEFLKIKPIPDYDAFNHFKDTKYFLREDLSLISGELSRIDQMDQSDRYLPCKALVECALFDWLSKKKAIPVCEFIQKRNKLLRYEIRNFFTLSLLDNRDQVIDMIDQGLSFTPNFKIKVNNDLQYVLDILQRVYDKLIKNKDYPGLLCLDCNCSWDVPTSLKFLDLLKQKPHLHQYLYMIEQPFPIDFDATSWVEVKKSYKENNIEIYADESIKTHQDILKLQSVITGVNVKLEKSGGYRGAVMNLIVAEQMKLKKWIGVMIGSSLNANQAVNLLEFSDVGADIDGSLHVTKECEKVNPIFEWGNEGTNWGRLKLK